jgi:hypothetical protein
MAVNEHQQLLRRHQQVGQLYERAHLIAQKRWGAVVRLVFARRLKILAQPRLVW